MKSPHPVTNKEAFDRWALQPWEKLRALPNDDGGMASVMLAFAIYERYIQVIDPSTQDEKATVQERSKRTKVAIAKDLGMPDAEAEAFWDTYRNGLMHTWQPKLRTRGGVDWSWELTVDDTLGEMPQVSRADSKIRLHPWKFVEMVKARWLSKIDSLDAVKASPLPFVIAQDYGGHSTGSGPNYPATPDPVANPLSNNSTRSPGDSV